MAFLTPAARMFATDLGLRQVDRVFLAFVGHHRSKGTRSIGWLGGEWTKWISKALEIQEQTPATRQLELPHARASPTESADAYRARIRADDARHADLRKATAPPELVAKFLDEAKRALDGPSAARTG